MVPDEVPAANRENRIESYRAVVIGGTGAVGSALVKELLAAPGCSRVTALTRRPVEQFDTVAGWEKLRLERVDFDALEAATADVARGSTLAFMTMGIGQARKVSREVLWRVDVEYAGAFARGAKAAGVRHISMLSSLGADQRSRSHYFHVKGSAEQVILDAGVVRTSLFRPSLLVTKDVRYGLQDRVTQAVFPWVSPVLPGRFHEIRVEELGRAMHLNSERGGAGIEALYYPDFRNLLDGGAPAR